MLRVSSILIVVAGLTGCFPDPPAPDTMEANADRETAEPDISPDIADGQVNLETAIDSEPDETADTTPDGLETEPPLDGSDVQPETTLSCAGDCSELDGPCTRGVCVNGACAPEFTTDICDDGNACTSGDRCDAGVCRGHFDGALCACGESSDCDDNNACNGIERCQSGQCVSGTPIVCSATQNVCQRNVCNTTSGSCALENLSGNACDDELACTTDDTCLAGVCGGQPVVCVPVLPCAESACQEPSGSCLHGIGTCGCTVDDDCDDGDACNGNEVCGADGQCRDGAPVHCAASTDDCKENVCRNGACVLAPLDDTVCDDGLNCTDSDRCTSGVCLGDERPCMDVVLCGIGSCSEPGGTCVFDRDACECVTDADCDDGNLCTGLEKCSPAGQCIDAADVVCAPSSVPCKKSVCAPGTGLCSLSNDDAAPCDDGQFCTIGDHCQSGSCVANPRDCGDGLGCTSDTCSENIDQCTHTAVNCCATDADCSDNLVCNGIETCNTATLACQPGAPPATGFPCNDGRACTGPDTCQAQVCGGPAIACDDGFSCSPDTCSEASGGCVSDTSRCQCTGNGQCNDGLTCTQDVCNSDGICVNSVSAGSCLIDGACYASGSTLGRAPDCGVCSPGTSQTAWTAKGGTNNWPLAMGYWANTSIASSVELSALCHASAVACHNCYVEAGSAASSASETASKITDALTRGADVIELDIVDVAGTPRISHDDTGVATRAALDDVLASSAWGSYRPILNLEIKELQATTAFLSKVIDALVNRGFAEPGRRVIIRAFSGLDSTLTLAKSIAGGNTHGSAFRFHVLFDTHQGATIAEMKLLIDAVVSKGFHGVEFNYRHRGLISKLNYARSKGLATGVWTLPVFLGEMLLGAIVDDTDLITSDLAIDVAKAVVGRNASLVDLDVSKLSAGGTQVSYFRSSPVQSLLTLSGPSAPTLISDANYGAQTALKFVGSSSQSLTLYDADNSAGEGYLVAFYGQLDIAASVPNDGDVRVLVGKADSGAISLELNNPAGAVPNLLRFAVNVGGTYYYTDLAATNVPSDAPVLIIAAYDGSGGIRMTIDGSDANVVVASANGGVLTNDSPLVIGADPQGAVTRRFFYDGTIQRVKVVSWPQNF